MPSFGLRSEAAETRAAERRSALPFDFPYAGYVYLSVSSAMPGFVQISTSREDPQGLAWSLQTFSGVTRFHTVCTARTRDYRGLTAQIQRALSTDQIPHHPDLFKIPLRFARQILESEARFFPPTPEAVPPPKAKGHLTALVAAAMLTAALLFSSFAHHAAPKVLPAYRHHAPQLRR